MFENLSFFKHTKFPKIFGCLEISKYIHKYWGTVGAEIIWRPLTARRRFMTKIFPHPLHSALLRCARSYMQSVNWHFSTLRAGDTLQPCWRGERVYNTSYFQAGSAEICSLLYFYSSYHISRHQIHPKRSWVDVSHFFDDNTFADKV